MTSAIDDVFDKMTVLYTTFCEPRVFMKGGVIVNIQTVWTSEEAEKLYQRYQEQLGSLFDEAKKHKFEYNFDGVRPFDRKP